MAKAAQDAQLAKPAPAGALAPAPDYIANERKGFETVNMMDTVLERISLVQTGSPEAVQGKFKPGSLIRRSVGEELYAIGGRPLKFTIVYYFKEYVQFGDRDSPTDSVVVARTTDPRHQLAEKARQWTKVKRPSGKTVREVQDVHNFVALLDGRPFEPLLIGAMKSNSKYGAGLLALTNSRGLKPIYGGSYQLFTENETNKKQQSYFVLKFKNDADSPWASAEIYKAAEQLHAMLSEAYTKGKLQGQYSADDTHADDGVEDVGKTGGDL